MSHRNDEQTWHRYFEHLRIYGNPCYFKPLLNDRACLDDIERCCKSQSRQEELQMTSKNDPPNQTKPDFRRKKRRRCRIFVLKDFPLCVS